MDNMLIFYSTAYDRQIPFAESPPPQVQSSPRIKFQHIQFNLGRGWCPGIYMDDIVLPPGNGSLIVWEDEEQGSR